MTKEENRKRRDWRFRRSRFGFVRFRVSDFGFPRAAHAITDAGERHKTPDK
jgi:hypothetical protein